MNKCKECGLPKGVHKLTCSENKRKPKKYYININKGAKRR